MNRTLFALAAILLMGCDSTPEASEMDDALRAYCASPVPLEWGAEDNTIRSYGVSDNPDAPPGHRSWHAAPAFSPPVTDYGVAPGLIVCSTSHYEVLEEREYDAGGTGRVQTFHRMRPATSVRIYRLRTAELLQEAVVQGTEPPPFTDEFSDATMYYGDLNIPGVEAAVTQGLAAL